MAINSWIELLSLELADFDSNNVQSLLSSSSSFSSLGLCISGANEYEATSLVYNHPIFKQNLSDAMSINAEEI